MDNKGNIKAGEFLYGVCFSLCFFAFMLTEAFINERCAVLLGARIVHLVYTAGLVCTGLGFLSFPALRSLCKKENTRKIALCLIGSFCLTASLLLLMTQKPIVFLLCAAAALLLFGHIGGCVYYHSAMFFMHSRYLGRILGIGMGTATILQFFVQNFTSHAVVFIISIFFSVAFVLYYIIRAPKDWILGNPLPYSSDGRTSHKTAVVLILAVILMSLVAGMIDSILTAFNAEKTYDVYSDVRLFYALGLILAGFIADIKERIYLPLVTICAMLLSSICMFFLSEDVNYFAGTALTYLYSGFYVIFFTVMFLDFAPKSKFPELWAGMGRIVRSFSVAATVLPALKVYDTVGSTALAVGCCLGSIGILLVLLPYISRVAATSEQDKKTFEQQELSPQERLKLYAQRCSLTPRETEVLEMLLSTDDDLQRIADNLYISRRMVQRYVSSIYEKTETKTRLGLYRSYMNFTAD